ncbi:hypothetical protein L0222_11860 [bacterium]|nr:hypothetical protein [bacterium]
MINQRFSVFVVLFFLTGFLQADNIIFTLADPIGDDNSEFTDHYLIANEIQPDDLDLVSLSAKSHRDGTIFEATFARPIKTPDSRAINEAGTTLQSYASNGFYTFNLDIYIDTDHVPGSGKTVSLPGRNALISATYGWEKAICLKPRPHYARQVLEDQMKHVALSEILARKGTLQPEDVTKVEGQVKSEIQNDTYFPTIVSVRGAKVQFFVPDSFFQGKAKAEWKYAVGVTISNVVERIHHAGARSLINPAAESSVVLPVPGLSIQEGLFTERPESAYVDMILPVEN